MTLFKPSLKIFVSIIILQNLFNSTPETPAVKFKQVGNLICYGRTIAWIAYIEILDENVFPFLETFFQLLLFAAFAARFAAYHVNFIKIYFHEIYLET